MFDQFLTDDTNLLTFSEQTLLTWLQEQANLSDEARQAIGTQAGKLVRHIRGDGKHSFLDNFLAEYGLSNDEGVALLSMAEAFLRVPDAETVDRLVQEKLTGSDWQSHSGHAASFLVNASTWALVLTGRLLSDKQARSLTDSMRRLLKRLGEPVVRTAMAEAMERMGDHFVIGESIDQALKRAGQKQHQGSFFSFDMLGEAAHTEADAQRYFESYQQAVTALAAEAGQDLLENPGISVKLSALHPRFEWLHREQSFQPLLERLLLLAQQAADANISLSIDAEEIHRLDYTLDLFTALAREMGDRHWSGLGVVVQAYSRYTPLVLSTLQGLARQLDCRFPVRLVKGAYWDTEIKRAQMLGLGQYPVFTRKCETDVSFLAAARTLLRMGAAVYPQFATHNAHTMAAVMHMAGEEKHRQWEFQRLYGMGAALHERVRQQHQTRHRIYAPVGDHEDLLAYLVRRLLENGANSSFVHQLTDRKVPVSRIVADPIVLANAKDSDAPALVRPGQLYGQRLNSSGWELGRRSEVEELLEMREAWAGHKWHTPPILEGDALTTKLFYMVNPARPLERVGTVQAASASDIEIAIAAAAAYQHAWADTPVVERQRLLLQTAELLTQNWDQIFALLTREAGKTLADAISEWREAIDFLRFYAGEAGHLDGAPRGPFACISPWNFPLAIFTGQIAAALVTGNTVLAKPAEQTPLVAGRMVELFHAAGVPRQALQLLPGDGERVGAALSRDTRIAGICFTGSLATAQHINRAMAEKLATDACLIAETGGINAMIVDSTALPEQAVEDIITSAFASAGQRCSALRVLYLQEDVADKMLTMLKGAMDALIVGDPWRVDTDVGPLIEAGAKAAIDRAVADYRPLHRITAPREGHFVAPVLLKVKGIADVKEEIFGPVLFVARYAARDLDRVIDDINAAGYGLTFAMHSRLVTRTERVVARLRIGNIYINRNQVGAVVQSQPFGGEGLSGTGPKAGGPYYLSAFQKYQHASAEVVAVDPDQGRALSLKSIRQAISSLDNQQWSLRQGRLQALKKVITDPSLLPEELLPAQRIMPGPTGERNRYHLVPLTGVLCLGPSSEQMLAQSATALACGCSVLIVGPANTVPAAIDKLQDLGAPVIALTGRISTDKLKKLAGLEAVCWFGNEETGRILRQTLADRSGPIVRFITAGSPIINYLHERHVCNDTTRAGGNIELMGKQS